LYFFVEVKRPPRAEGATGVASAHARNKGMKSASRGGGRGQVERANPVQEGELPEAEVRRRAALEDLLAAMQRGFPLGGIRISREELYEED
jgi:hypothetical protein